jgi:hypothetical protein
MARMTKSRTLRRIILGCALGLAMAGRPRAVSAFQEQALPAAEMASPSASPSPQAASQEPGPGAPGAAPTSTPGAAAAEQPAVRNGGQPSSAGASNEDQGGWARVPGAGESANGAIPAGAGPASGPPAAASEAGTAEPAQAPAPGAPVAGEPAPQASPSEAPPPYDVGSIQPTAPVSDQPLSPLIDSTKDQPALNASLRFVEQGRQAIGASRLDDAIRDLGRAVSIDPTDPYAYFYLGRAYMIKKDYGQALAFFGRSEVGLRTTPAWLGEAKGFEGACLEEQGKFPAAAAAYKQALDIDPGNIMARAGYGRMNENQSAADAAAAAPPSTDSAALPAPGVNMAPPPPSEPGPPAAEPVPSADAGPGADWTAESKPGRGAPRNDAGDTGGQDAQ